MSPDSEYKRAASVKQYKSDALGPFPFAAFFAGDCVSLGAYS